MEQPIVPHLIRTDSAPWKRPSSKPASLLLSGILGLFLVACGGGSSDPDVIQNPDAQDALADPGGQPDIVQGDLTATIVIDKLKGNAPLTVHLESEVKGCAAADSEYLWTFGPGTYSTKKDPGDFIFHQLGLFTIEFQVTCNTNGGTAKDSVQVLVMDSADLDLSQVKITSAIEVAPGDVVLLSFSLFNKGDLIEDPFKLLVALSKDELYQEETDQVLKEINLEGMEDGRYKEVKISYVDEAAPLPPDTPEGAYFLFVIADPDDVVTESDEDNNVEQATSLITVSETAKFKADLTVTPPDFFQGTTVFPGKSVSYAIDLINQGQAEAKNFRYAVYASTDTELSEDDVRLTSEDSDMIFSLDADKTLAISGLLKVPQGMATGQYYAIARVDLTNSVAEDSESNNVAVSPWVFEVVEEVVLGYDLSLDSIEVSPHDTYLGGSVKVVSQVSNPGNKPSPAVPIAFFISDEPGLNPNYDTKVGNQVAASLPPGGESTLTYVVPMPTLLKPGDYYFSVVLDVDGVLDELDETNNWQLDEQVLHVYQEAFVDVGLADLVVHPMVVDAGKEIKVAYDMTNIGSTASGAFTNYVVLSQDQTVNIGEAKSGKDIVIAKVALDEVVPSVKVERVEKIPVPVSLPHDIGQYYVGVIGDADGNLVADSNKSNHILVSVNPLTVLDPQGGCHEDELEPNNDANQAWEMDAVLTEGLGLCGGEDWYAVEVQAGQSLVATITLTSPLFLEPRPYDLDLDILDPDGIMVDRAATVGDQDVAAVFAVEEGGSYLVRVYPKSVSNQAHYDLDLNVLEPGEGVDLMPVHVVESPDVIYPGGLVTVTATVVNLGLDPATASSAALVLSQDALVDEEDLELAVIEVPAVDGTSKVDVEETVFLPLETFGGDYYILVDVDPADLIDETDEGNNVGVSGILFVDESMKCEDDDLEPNNDTATATMLAAESASFSDLTVCPYLPDVFQVTLPEGVLFSVTVNYEHKGDKGYVALDLLDGSQTAILDTVTNSKNPVIGLPYVFHGGTYYVRVRVDPAGGKGGPYVYTMTVNLGEALPGDVCMADVHEPNNDFEGASVIGCGSNHLTLCKKDRDFYRVSLTAGESLWADLHQSEAKLKAGLYVDPKGNPVQKVSGNGSLNFVAEEDVVVFLAVEAKSSSTVLTDFDYTLAVDGVPGWDLAVGDVALNPLEVDQGEDVQVTFQVTNDCQEAIPGFDYRVYLSADELLDEGDVPVLEGTFDETLEPKTPTDLTVKVMAPLDAEPGPYHLIIFVDPEDAVAESQEDNNVASAALSVAQVCLDDPLEPNDAPDEAAFIGPGSFGSMKVCPFDADWFAFQAEPGNVITVTMEAPLETGDLDVRLYEASDPSKPVAVSATGSDVESLTWEAQVSGEHLIRINGFLGASATYKMVLGIE